MGRHAELDGPSEQRGVVLPAFDLDEQPIAVESEQFGALQQRPNAFDQYRIVSGDGRDSRQDPVLVGFRCVPVCLRTLQCLGEHAPGHDRVTRLERPVRSHTGPISLGVSRGVVRCVARSVVRSVLGGKSQQFVQSADILRHVRTDTGGQVRHRGVHRMVDVLLGDPADQITRLAIAGTMVRIGERAMVPVEERPAQLPAQSRIRLETGGLLQQATHELVDVRCRRPGRVPFGVHRTVHGSDIDRGDPAGLPVVEPVMDVRIAVGERVPTQSGLRRRLQ